MPGPAPRASMRGFADFVIKRIPERLLDMSETRSGKPVPEALDLHKKVMDTFVDVGYFMGGVNKQTEKLVTTMSDLSAALEINPFLGKVDEVPGTKFGEYRVVKALENPAQAASMGLTGKVAQLIQDLKEVNLSTGSIAEGGKWNEIRRTPIDQQQFNELMTASRAQPGGDKELELATLASKDNVGRVEKVGQLSLKRDGHWHPFKTREGERWVRMPTEELQAMVMQGPESPRMAELIDALATHPINVAAGVTPESVREWAIRGQKSMTTIGNMNDGGTGTIAIEHIREMPWFPSAIREGKQWHELIEVDPVRYSNRLRRSHALHLAYSKNFGQGVSDKYIDRNSMELVEVVKRDEWGDLTKKVLDAHGDNRLEATLNETQRVMNGLPLERRMLEPFSKEWWAWKAWETGTTVLKTTLLSGSLFVNIPELFFGTTAADYGFRNNLRVLANRYKMSKSQFETEYSVLDEMNAVSPSIFDFSFNRNHPLRDSIRIMQQAAGRVFGYNFMNELQEYMAPAVAMDRVEHWRKHGASALDIAALKNSKLFTPDQIRGLATGTADSNTHQLFISAVAQMNTGSPLNPINQSRAGHSKAFNVLFPFMSYGRAKMNSLSRAADGVIRAHGEIKSGGAKGFEAAMKTMRTPETAILGRHVGFTTAQGIGGYLLLSLAFGGATGLSVAVNEAEDAPGKFITEAFLFNAVSGPYGQILRYAVNPSDPPSAALAKSLFPGAMLDEVHALITSQGAYKNMTPFERSVEFFRRKTPATGPVSTGLAIMGLSDRDAGLEGAIRGYWKWRFEEAKPGRTSPGAASAEDVKFRQAMRRAMDKIRKNQDPSADVADALAVDGKNAQAAKQSILARRLLKPLDAVEQEALRRRIGDKGFAKIAAYDELLESWAGRVA